MLIETTGVDIKESAAPPSGENVTSLSCVECTANNTTIDTHLSPFDSHNATSGHSSIREPFTSTVKYAGEKSTGNPFNFLSRRPKTDRSDLSARWSSSIEMSAAPSMQTVLDFNERNITVLPPEEQTFYHQFVDILSSSVSSNDSSWQNIKHPCISNLTHCPGRYNTEQDQFNQVNTSAIYNFYSTDGANCTNGGNSNTTECLYTTIPVLPTIPFTILDILLAAFLAAFIICIIIGNILVVSSVLLFRDMRTLTNALIVSLALADLLVAIIVLPLSLHFEITGHVWTLGPIICDFWTTSDVFCCTASILNIVVIAMDRYWLITMNVRYTHSVRFPRKRVCAVMITLAWSLSLIISISPLLGWKAGDEKQMTEGKCLISQDLAYTIFSTFGAFWFPLSVILITYFKIFKIARKRAQSRAKSRSICPSINTETVGTDMLTNSMRNGRNSEQLDSKRCSMVSKRLLDNPDQEVDAVALDLSPVTAPDSKVTGSPGDDDKPDNHYTTVNNNTYLETSINSPGPTESPELYTESNGVTVSDNPHKRYSNDDSVQNNHDSKKHSTCNNHRATSVKRTSSSSIFTKNNYFRNKKRRHFQRLGQCRSSRMRYRNRMRSSARTLGLIIGCFVLCWMPFFIIATVVPFCVACAESIPPILGSVVTWLGYSNSLLNPAIYAIWDKNFRRSFKKVLKCNINWSHVF